MCSLVTTAYTGNRTLHKKCGGNGSMEGERRKVAEGKKGESRLGNDDDECRRGCCF